MLTLTAQYPGPGLYWAMLRSDRRESFGEKRVLVTGREYNYGLLAQHDRVLEKRAREDGGFGYVNILQAISEMSGKILCRVQINDGVEFDAGRVVASNRKIVASAKVEHWLHEQSIGWMTSVLDQVPDPDSPSEEDHMRILRRGVELKQAWLAGEETTENLLLYLDHIDNSCTGFSCRRDNSNEYWLWYLAGRALRYGYDFNDMDGRCLVKVIPGIATMAAGYTHALLTGENAGPGEWMHDHTLNREMATAALEFLRERSRYVETVEAAAA